MMKKFGIAFLLLACFSAGAASTHLFKTAFHSRILNKKRKADVNSLLEIRGGGQTEKVVKTVAWIQGLQAVALILAPNVLIKSYGLEEDNVSASLAESSGRNSLGIHAAILMCLNGQSMDKVVIFGVVMGLLANVKSILNNFNQVIALKSKLLVFTSAVKVGALVAIIEDNKSVKPVTQALAAWYILNGLFMYASPARFGAFCGLKVDTSTKIFVKLYGASIFRVAMLWVMLSLRQSALIAYGFSSFLQILVIMDFIFLSKSGCHPAKAFFNIAMAAAVVFVTLPKLAKSVSTKAKDVS
mmetsp:Transcript_14352/g.21115  ORF Transcript_14352/g.21115 Transcript_14352/m.21115 type:complete len:299 (-) Transcript_14352:140-1036(-)